MKKTGLFAIAAALILPTFASAQLKGADKNADVAKILQANKSVSTIQCPFSRTTKVAAIADAAKSEGNFYFESPNNLAMKYSDGEIFVVTEENVSLSVGGKARTLRAGNHHVEDLAETLVACIRGDVAAIEDGTLKSSKTQGNNIVLTISTEMKVGRNSVTTIELAYCKKDYTLVYLKLVEKDGSYTLYELKDKTLNKAIDAKTFEHAKAKNKTSKGKATTNAKSSKK